MHVHVDETRRQDQPVRVQGGVRRSVNPRIGFSTVLKGATFVASWGRFSQAPDFQFLVDAFASDLPFAAFDWRGFGERELDWKIDRFPLSPGLGEALRQQLGPIRFTPGFFQATAGLSVRF